MALITASDPDIFKIALTLRKVERLLVTEERVEPTTRMVGTWWYIGKRDDALFAFENNLHDHTAERVRLTGKLDAIYYCDARERGLPIYS